MAEAITVKEHRFIFLDGLRGLAAICVMVYHYTIFTNFPIFLRAGIAVDFFFCLSGFVIASGYQSKIFNGMPFNHYVLKRLYRLYPTFLIGLIIGFVAIAFKIHAGQTNLTDIDALKAFALNSLFLPFFHHGYVLNFNYKLIGEIFPFDTSYWSLFFELFVNICFFFTVGNSRNFAYAYGLAIVAFVFTVLKYNAVAAGWGTDNFFSGFPRVFVGFFGGVLVFQLYQWMISNPSVPVERGIAFIVKHSNAFIVGLSLLFLLICRGTTHAIRFVYLAEVLVMPAIVLIAAFVVPKSLNLHKILVKLGILSYPLYCLQYPVLHLAQAIDKLDGLNLNPLTIAAISMVCTFAASYLILDYIDQTVPAYLGRKFLSRP